MDDKQKLKLYHCCANKVYLLAGEIPDKKDITIKYYLQQIRMCAFDMINEENLDQLKRLNSCINSNADLLIAAIAEKLETAKELRAASHMTDKI